MKRVLALGFFDGVHLGHQALLEEVCSVSAKTGLSPAAVTFRLPPTQVLRGDAPPQINRLSERSFMLTDLFHMKDVCVLETTQELLDMDWRSYIQDCLITQLEAGHIVAGYDHRFGHRGEGDATRLQALCAEAGIGCSIVPAVERLGAPVSSSRIRSLLPTQPNEAITLLGHPHLISGTVAHGERIGRTLGYPTVNLALEPNIVAPAHGVYASQMMVDGATHLAITNIGTRPTFYEDAAVTVESFLLDFHGDLYGKDLQLFLHHYLRPERRFEHRDALVEEIGRNIEQARAYFKEV